MAIRKILTQGATAQNYLKVESASMNSVKSTMTAENECDRLPARVDFVVNYIIFENKDARVASDTNPFIVKLSGSRTVHFIPQLPEGWVPISTDPQEIEEEKAIAMGYVALRSTEEFSTVEWEDYQP